MDRLESIISDSVMRHTPRLQWPFIHDAMEHDMIDKSLIKIFSALCSGKEPDLSSQATVHNPILNSCHKRNEDGF